MSPFTLVSNTYALSLLVPLQLALLSFHLYCAHGTSVYVSPGSIGYIPQNEGEQEGVFFFFLFLRLCDLSQYYTLYAHQFFCNFCDFVFL